MARNSGTDILNIQPNPELGFGEDVAIPVVAKDQKFNEVNKVAQDLLLQDHQNNLLLYQQKIKDRDKMLELFAEGQVQSGKILDGDKKYYDDAEKKKNEAYKNIKGMDDREGISAYLKAHNELKDLVTNLQHRWTEITKQEQEKAQETLPDDQKTRQDHIDKMIAQKPGELVTPFQKALSLDEPSMRQWIYGAPTPSKKTTVKDGDITTVTTTTLPGTPGAATATGTGKNKISPLPTGAKPIAAQPDKIPHGYIQTSPGWQYNLDDFLRNANTGYWEDRNQQQYQTKWFDTFHNSEEWMKKNLIEKENKRLREYAEETGLAPTGKDANGNNTYDATIQWAIGPDGKIVLKEDAPTFAAKHALAMVPGPYKAGPSYEKDYKQLQIDVENKKANAEVAKARSAAALNYAKIDKMKQGAEQDAARVNWFRTNFTQQETLFNPDGTLKAISADNSTPILTFDGNDAKKIITLKPIGVTRIYDRYEPIEIIENGKAKQIPGTSTNGAQPAKDAKIVKQVGGEYVPSLIYGNKTLGKDDFDIKYNDFVTAYESLYKKKPSTTKEEFWKGVVEQGHLPGEYIPIKLKLKGEGNGSSTEEVHVSAANSISNQASSGNETPIFLQENENN